MLVRLPILHVDDQRQHDSGFVFFHALKTDRSDGSGLIEHEINVYWLERCLRCYCTGTFSSLPKMNEGFRSALDNE